MAVKSKSMATEEIHLNDALEAIGVTPVETDLGEYIIQLAHERPSHIIAPAIHKTKGQIADLFGKELKRTVPADPDRKSTRLNSSHSQISYAVFCLKKKKTQQMNE